MPYCNGILKGFISLEDIKTSFDKGRTAGMREHKNLHCLYSRLSNPSLVEPLLHLLTITLGRVTLSWSSIFITTNGLASALAICQVFMFTNPLQVSPTALLPITTSPCN